MKTPFRGGDRPLFGVAGVGSLGFHHARILSEIAGGSLGGVFDIDKPRATQVANEFNVQATTELDPLLDRIDGLVVSTPTGSHEAVAIRALEAGIPVFVEKPIAPNMAAAENMLAVAEAADLWIQVGHVERFNSVFRAARAYVEEPLFIESHRLSPFGVRGIDVAVVLDLMIHDVDLVRAVVDRPIESIAASGVPIITSSVDIANARLSFVGGAVANLTASRVSLEKMRKLRIFQRSGYLSLDLATGRGEFLRLREPLPSFEEGEEITLPPLGLASLVERITIEGDDAEPLRMELEAFRAAVMGEADPPVSGKEGRDALQVALAIQELIDSHVAHTRTA